MLYKLHLRVVSAMNLQLLKVTKPCTVDTADCSVPILNAEIQIPLEVVSIIS